MRTEEPALRLAWLVPASSLRPALLPLRLSAPERAPMGELDPPPLLGPLSRLATLSLHTPGPLSRLATLSLHVPGDAHCSCASLAAVCTEPVHQQRADWPAACGPPAADLLRHAARVEGLG